MNLILHNVKTAEYKFHTNNVGISFAAILAAHLIVTIKGRASAPVPRFVAVVNLKS